METDLIAMLLRDQPPCTAAEISDFAIAFWDGEKLTWVWLKDERVGSRFALDFDIWDQLCAYVDDWLATPRYSVRPELREWMKETQHKAG